MPEGESWQGLGGAALGAQAAQAWDSVPSESDSLGAIISTRKGVLKQQKYIVSQSWRLESEMEVLAGHTHWKGQGEDPSLSLPAFRVSGNPWCPWALWLVSLQSVSVPGHRHPLWAVSVCLSSYKDTSFWIKGLPAAVTLFP